MSVLTCDQVRDMAEGFVLGALDPNQTHDVRDHLASCPNPHPEMDELGGAVPYLAESIEPVEPPEALKGRIMAAIDAELRAGKRAEAAADRLISSLGAGSVVRVAPAGPVAMEPTPDSAGASDPPVNLDAARARRRSRLGWIAAIAAAVVIAGLGAWNIGLSGQLSAAQQQQAAVDRVLAIAQEPGGEAAILIPGATAGPAGLAAVAPDGSFALAMHGLAATNGSQVYEAWVIAPSGTPVPIGSFVVGSDGTGSLTAARVPVTAGLTVGLTREANPGATTPTLPMVVSGVAAQGG